MAEHAVVTGAGSGIGRETAHLLSALGYTVTAVGRTLSSLEETSRTAPGPGSIAPLVLDVGDHHAVATAFDPIARLQVLVASAGVCAQGRLDETDADRVWERTMSTNVDGVWYLFRALHAKLTPGGRAVVVSSGLGKLGRLGYGAYTASKHAVLGLVKCFSKELAPRGVTVNAVCPGWVQTGMSAADLVHTAKMNGTTPEEERRLAHAAIPIGRFVTAREVADLILYLCSPGAAGITGQAYNISGGEFFA